MGIPEKINLGNFFYQLPDHRIAAYPLQQRDGSKLLFYQNNQVSESRFSHLPDLLPDSSCLVFNNTRVIRARLHFQKKSGASVEIFCLEPVKPPVIEQALSQTNSCTWRCLVGNARRWKTGTLEKTVTDGHQNFTLTAEKTEQENDTAIIRFSWDNNIFTFAEVITLCGMVPLPPYIKRAAEPSDTTRYQTIYADHPGSVAAPTAGLHFTPGVMDDLRKKNMYLLYLTLHVGAGTFKPISSKSLMDHRMHAEPVLIEKKLVEKLLAHITLHHPIISVGTTSLRTLESIYWFGVKLFENPGFSGPFSISQWEPYQSNYRCTIIESLQSILAYFNLQQETIIQGTTQLMIIPGYEFKVATGLITNFHQPGSTLLLLIAAFTGNNWKEIYQYALDHEFRFLSYGDSSLLIRDTQ